MTINQHALRNNIPMPESSACVGRPDSQILPQPHLELKLKIVHQIKAGYMQSLEKITTARLNDPDAIYLLIQN
jgi:hypothetical protein